MKARDLMTAAVLTCGPDTDLAKAGRELWDGDCGALPVVEGSRVVGLITDRDIAIAGATKGRPLHDIRVRELMDGKDLLLIGLDQDLSDALDLMSYHQVRRLPVTDPEGNLAGILSMNDVILAAEKAPRRTPGAPSYDDVLAALRNISRPRPRAELERPAASEKDTP